MAIEVDDIYSHIFVALLAAITTTILVTQLIYRKSARNGNLRKKICSKRQDNLSITRTFKEAQEKLNAPKRIITIAENVYVAMGYGLANIIFIQGETSPD